VELAFKELLLFWAGCDGKSNAVEGSRGFSIVHSG
jgi:hypothetical protein